MTINELKQLEDKYGSKSAVIGDVADLIAKKVLRIDNRLSEETLPFWSKVLDHVDDDYVKQLVYEAIQEYVYYHERDCFDDIDELSQAFMDDRLFVFPFKPGDFIQKSYDSPPEQIISIEMTEAGCYPTINTEKRTVEKIVNITHNEISYPEFDKYRKVDSVKTYGLYSKYGEEIDYYWQ